MLEIIDNIEQGSQEWLKLRAGKFTGSDFHTLLGNSETKKKLLYRKSIERLNNVSLQENIITEDIERGKEEEKNARFLYEMETNAIVREIAFAKLNDWVGCSPDGLIGEDGLIEIKCPKDVIFASQIITDTIKPEYYTQIQFNMYVLDRQWCDYIMYNQNFKLYIKRIYRDEDFIEKIKTSIEECKNIILHNMNLLVSYKL